MHDLAILFAYHATDPSLVRKHYFCFKRDNPGVPVVPLSHWSLDWVPGTVDTSRLESIWVTQEESLPGKPDGRADWLWMHCDQIFWRYLRSPGRVEAARYALFCWDVFSHNMPARVFFEDVWDAPISGVTVVTPVTTPVWWWHAPAWEQIDHGLLKGIVPVDGTLLSRETALFLANTRMPDNLYPAFCEMGYPTLCAVNGILPVENTRRQTMIGAWGGRQWWRDEPGLYHPIIHELPQHPQGVIL